MSELLTHSRQDCFKTCRKKHWFAYELALRPIEDAKALRMGSAYHAGLEVLGRHGSLDKAVDAARAYYTTCPPFIDQYDWDIESETIARLLCAYQWRWERFGLENIAAEQGFQLPLTNPETGKPTPCFDRAGKIDGIVRLEDGRLAVKESKLLGDDISPDAELWRRLRIDGQISGYINAARDLGYQCDTVLYDVTRKPTIKPESVPLVDEDGIKIVLDAGGNRVKTQKGAWRQTADKDAGYVLQTRRMTVDEWGEKLTADICERPEFYFARVEVPRLDQDLEAYRIELWDIQKTIRDAQLNDRWYRTVNRSTCPFCSYFNLCTTGFEPNGVPPEGFGYVANKHPELEVANEHHAPASSF